MKVPCTKRITGFWRVAWRHMLLVILFLGLVKTPLAYSCQPSATGDSGTAFASHIKNSEADCFPAGNGAVPIAAETDCCVVEIDHGIRGTEDGFLVPTLTKPSKLSDADQSAGLPAADIRYSVNPYPPAAVNFPQTAAYSLPHQPPYLITQRFRF